MARAKLADKRVLVRALHALVAMLIALGAIASLPMTQAAATVSVLLRADQPSDVAPGEAATGDTVLDHRYLGRREVAARSRTAADHGSPASPVLAHAPAVIPGRRMTAGPHHSLDGEVWRSEGPRRRSMVFLN